MGFAGKIFVACDDALEKTPKSILRHLKKCQQSFVVFFGKKDFFYFESLF